MSILSTKTLKFGIILIVKLCLLFCYSLNMIVKKLANYNLIAKNRNEVNNHEHNNSATITPEAQSS